MYFSTPRDSILYTFEHFLQTNNQSPKKVDNN